MIVCNKFLTLIRYTWFFQSSIFNQIIISSHYPNFFHSHATCSVGFCHAPLSTCRPQRPHTAWGPFGHRDPPKCATPHSLGRKPSVWPCGFFRVFSQPFPPPEETKKTTSIGLTFMVSEIQELSYLKIKKSPNFGNSKFFNIQNPASDLKIKAP